MQAKARYLPPHRIEGGSLENVVWGRPNAARAIAPQGIFAQTNPITQPGAYEGIFFHWGGGGGGGRGVHHVATCKSEWQQGTTSSTTSTASSTSSLTAFWVTSPSTRFRSN